MELVPTSVGGGIKGQLVPEAHSLVPSNVLKKIACIHWPMHCASKMEPLQEGRGHFRIEWEVLHEL